MRTDIEIHTQTGDVQFVSKENYTLRKFRWVSPDNGFESFAYGEVLVPSGTNKSKVLANGVYFQIPYTPIAKPFKIRIVELNEAGDGIKTSGDKITFNNNVEWVNVVCSLYGDNQRLINASETILVSNKAIRGVISKDRNGKDVMQIYSSEISDFNIVEAKNQNMNFLLSCSPSNNYRYPVSGVGLVRWLNSTDINHTSLPSVIEKEFDEDGMSVVKAVYNYDNSTLEMSVNEYKQ